MLKYASLYIVTISWIKAGLVDGTQKVFLLVFLLIILALILFKCKGRINSINIIYLSLVIPLLFIMSYLNPQYRVISQVDLKELNFKERLQTTKNFEGGKFLTERFKSILSTKQHSSSQSIAIFFDSLEVYKSKYGSNNNDNLWLFLNELLKRIKLNDLPFFPSLTIVDNNILLRFVFWYSNILLIFLWVFKTIKRDDLNTIYWIIFLNCTILALVGIVQKLYYIPSDNQLEILGIWDTPEPRYFFSTFTYKNHWSAFAILSLFYGACIVRSELSIWGTYILRSNTFFLILLCSLIIIASVLYSGSRSGILLLIFSVSIILILFTKNYLSLNFKKLVAYTFLTITLLILGICVFLNSKVPTANEMISTTKIQINELSKGKLPLRWYLWRDAVGVGRQKPFYGHGFNSYASINPLFQSTFVRDTRSYGLEAAHNPYIPLVAHVHNDWFEWWCEWGLLGLLLLFIPILIISTALLSGNFSLNVKLLIAGVLMILIYSCIDFPTRSPACLALFCFTFGISLARAKREI